MYQNKPRRLADWVRVSCVLLALSVCQAEISPVRRTTIATADVEASLRFYRDLLGFVVEYDVAVTDPEQLQLYDPNATQGRAVALRRETLGGSIGLFWSPALQAPKSCDAVETGTVSILLLTDDLLALQEKLENAGVRILKKAVGYSRSRGPTLAFTVFDPNCVRVAVAEILEETFDESVAK